LRANLTAIRFAPLLRSLHCACTKLSINKPTPPPKDVIRIAVKSDNASQTWQNYAIKSFGKLLTLPTADTDKMDHRLNFRDERVGCVSPLIDFEFCNLRAEFPQRYCR